MAEPVRAAAVVPWDRCVEFATRAFEACGMPPEQAHDAAEALVDADVHGTSTHGLKNLRRYVLELREGNANPRPNIRVIGGGKASAVMTGDGALGHVAAYAGMRKAIELAREYSVGTVIVRDSNHYGHSGFWASLPVRQNMIGFAVTNATAGMAAWGGKDPLIGNNPPSWAAPTKVVDPASASGGLAPGEYDPLFLDMALSVVAGNRLDIYHRRGEPIPLGWALDRDGNPTTSAIAKLEGGTLAPISTYKGSGLSIMLSTITSFLAAAPFDTGRIDLQTMKRVPGSTGHWFAAYDIAQFTDLEEFCRNVRETRDLIRSTPPKAGVERVYAPGDIENEKARKHRKEGIPLEQFCIDDLAWVAEQLGLEWNLV